METSSCLTRVSSLLELQPHFFLRWPIPRISWLTTLASMSSDIALPRINSARVLVCSFFFAGRRLEFWKSTKESILTNTRCRSRERDSMMRLKSSPRNRRTKLRSGTVMWPVSMNCGQLTLTLRMKIGYVLHTALFPCISSENRPSADGASGFEFSISRYLRAAPALSELGLYVHLPQMFSRPPLSAWPDFEGVWSRGDGPPTLARVALRGNPGQLINFNKCTALGIVFFTASKKIKKVVCGRFLWFVGCRWSPPTIALARFLFLARFRKRKWLPWCRCLTMNLVRGVFADHA